MAGAPHHHKAAMRRPYDYGALFGWNGEGFLRLNGVGAGGRGVEGSGASGEGIGSRGIWTNRKEKSNGAAFEKEKRGNDRCGKMGIGPALLGKKGVWAPLKSYKFYRNSG